MSALPRTVSELSELPSSAWLTPQEAADYMRLSKAGLAVRRCKGQDDIKYFKQGRIVRYRKRDLDSYLEAV